MLPSVHNLCIQTHAHTRTHTHAYKHTHACIQTNTHRLPSVPPLPLGATALSQRFDPTATEVVPSFRRTSTVLTAAQQQVGVHVLPNNRWVYSIVPSFRWTSTIFTATQQQVRVGCMNVQLAVMCKIFKRMYMSRVGQNRISAPYMTVCMVLSLLKIPFVHRLCL